jgi:hypothetical protein
MLLMPNNSRPTNSNKNTGAKLWRKMHPVAIERVATVSHLGENREVAQLRGMASAMFPQWDAEPNSPCWLGERSRSALMAGSKIPNVFNTMKEDTLENSHTLMTVQRYLL